jgi:hypothetical protein
MELPGPTSVLNDILFATKSAEETEKMPPHQVVIAIQELYKHLANHSNTALQAKCRIGYLWALVNSPRFEVFRAQNGHQKGIAKLLNIGKTELNRCRKLFQLCDIYPRFLDAKIPLSLYDFYSSLPRVKLFLEYDVNMSAKFWRGELDIMVYIPHLNAIIAKKPMSVKQAGQQFQTLSPGLSADVFRMTVSGNQ